MKLRLALLGAIAAVWAGCQCGASSPCDGITCVSPLVCDPINGRCKLGPGGGSGGGSDGGSSVGGGSGGSGGGGSVGGGQGGGGAACNLSCSAPTPVCDPVTTSCKTCTASAGCSGSTPVCDTAGNAGAGRCVTCTQTSGCVGSTPFCDQSVQPSGACYGCRNFADCPVFGTTCELATHTCVQDDGGGTGGGSGVGGGTGAGGGGGTVIFDDAGMTAHCLPFDGGTQSCTGECDRGFVCINGQCQLRGNSGPVQITLRFPVSEDLDLHVVEPVDGGTCEIWYGNTNAPPFDAGFPLPFPIPQPPSCGAKGWLDLDSNPACTLDNVNVENVIYPPSQGPYRGLYKVRVDYYQHCSASSPVPYEVEVRANGATRYYCGTFDPGSANGGNAGSGVDITQFTIP